MLDGLPIWAVFAVFAAAALVIAWAGVKITGVADRLADQTGMGEAITGAILLGMTTSLSGTVVSVVSALDGDASLAFSNGIGGIAAQTFFLALADMIYRRANIEHAAADIANVFQAGLLLAMLSLPLIAWASPEWSVLAVHPVSIVLFLAYVFGSRAGAKIGENPMWKPVRTKETRQEQPDEERQHGRALLPMALRFAGLAAVLGLAGYVVSQCAPPMAQAMGLSSTAIGALVTATATSLPELVTTLAAVRRGAAQLAVGGIIGGNSFDVLFLTLSDIAYRDGSLYHAVGPQDLFWIMVSLLMTAILLMGLVAREKRGPGGIGVESVLLIVVYAGAVALQSVQG